MSDPVKLEFSEKYDRAHAQKYFDKHRNSFARRMSHRRDEQLARKALALVGEPGLVLDLPCGAGRFWPLLAEKHNRVIIGADNSAAMVETACASQPKDIVERVQPLQTSAFDIALPDNSVDSIFCMRLLHHIGEAEHRLTILRQFHRVTRDSVVLSLWVDGNFKAWKRERARTASTSAQRSGRVSEPLRVACGDRGSGVHPGRFPYSGAPGLFADVRHVARVRSS
ncbi:ubiquinone/menaquinone biosynthesis C-methylase UbiE [Pseudomonas sp. PvP001]